MGERAIWAWQDRVAASGTVLTATSKLGDNAAGNVADPRCGKFWRTSGLTDALLADFGSNVSLQLLYLRFSRRVDLPGGTVTHELYTDGQTPGVSTPAHTTGALTLGLEARWAQHWHLLASQGSYRYWRVVYGLSGVTFADLVRASALPIFRPGHGVFPGATQDAGSLSLVRVSEISGAKFREARPLKRRWGVNHGEIGAADKRTFEDMIETVGTDGEVWFVKDPGEATYPNRELLWGGIARGAVIAQPNLPAGFQADFEIEENV